MPPTNNQPENLNPNTPTQTPEVPVAPVFTPEQLAAQTVKPEINPGVGENSEKQSTLSSQAQPPEAPKSVNLAEPKGSSAEDAAKMGLGNTPKELGRKFEVIEGMTDDPYAAQEAFKKEQSAYLSTLGENLDRTA